MCGSIIAFVRRISRAGICLVFLAAAAAIILLLARHPHVRDATVAPMPPAAVTNAATSAAAPADEPALSPDGAGQGNDAEGDRIYGEVVDEAGTPVCGASYELDAETTVVLDKGCGIVFTFAAGDAALPDKAGFHLMQEHSPKFFSRTLQAPIEDGRAEAWTLQPGTYTAQIDLAGFVPMALRDLVVTPEAPLEVTVPLARGGSVAGVVCDADSKLPLQGAQVTLSRGPTVPQDRVTTGPEGTYRFERVLGKARIRLTHPERCPERTPELEVREDETLDAPVVYLRTGGTILCRVVNIPEGSVSGLSVFFRWLQDPDGYGGMLGHSGSGSLPSKWEHAFENSHTGTYQLSVSVRSAKPAAAPDAARTGFSKESRWSREVTLPEGVEEAEVTFDLATPPDEK